MPQLTEPRRLAARILGVEMSAMLPEVQYGYYRLMIIYHPDKNPDNPNAGRFAALLNEAKDVLLGKEPNPVLLKDTDLISDFLNCPVSGEEVLSYEEWLKKRFYDMDNCSIWPG